MGPPRAGATGSAVDTFAQAVAPIQETQPKRHRGRVPLWIVRIGVIAVFLALVEVAVRTEILNPFFVPEPSAVLVGMLAPGQQHEQSCHAAVERGAPV